MDLQRAKNNKKKTIDLGNCSVDKVLAAQVWGLELRSSKTTKMSHEYDIPSVIPVFLEGENKDSLGQAG